MENTNEMTKSDNLFHFWSYQSQNTHPHEIKVLEYIITVIDTLEKTKQLFLSDSVYHHICSQITWKNNHNCFSFEVPVNFLYLICPDVSEVTGCPNKDCNFS